MRLRLLLAALLLIAAGSAGAQERVAVRGGAHADFGRLVFDWTSPVEYGATIEDGRLIVTFDRATEFDTSSAERHLFRYLETVRRSEDGRSLTFDLTRAFGLETFRLDTKVVVDLLQDASQVSAVPAPAAAAATARLLAAVPADTPPPASEPSAQAQAQPQPQAQPQSQPQSLPEVRVRVGEHTAFERLVFDWPAPVGYQVEQDASGARVVFERPARLDVSRLQADPPSLLRRFEDRRVDGKLSVALQYLPGTRVRAFADGPRVVVDLLRPDGREPQTASAAETVPSPDTAGSDSPQAESLQAESDTGDRSDSVGAVEQTAAGEAVGAPTPLIPAAPAVAPAQDAEPSAEAAAPPEQDAQISSQAREEQPTEAAADVAAETAFVVREVLPDVEARPAPGTHSSQTPPVLLRFAWPEGVGAVALRRGAALLLGFDRAAPVDLAEAVAEVAPELGPARAETVEDGSLLSFDEAGLYAARLWRDDGGWLVEFHRAGGEWAGNPPLVVEREADSASLRVAVDRPRRLLSLKDPGGGDRLLLVPLAREGEAIFEGRQSPAFDLLSTYQGIAILPRLEPLKVDLTGDGVVIVAPGPAVTPASELSDASVSPAAVEARLFDLETWRQGGPEEFNARRQELQRGAVQVEGARQGLARLDLARFYFAHGLASETLGMLALIDRENADLRAGPQVMLMEAASRLITGDHAEAQALLAGPSLLEEPEADLWRAALAAEAQDWPAAASLFARSSALIADYARPMRVRLGHSAAEAALESGDIGAAAEHLERTEEDLLTDLEQARHDFLGALLISAEGNDEEAEEILRRLAGSGLGAPAVQARLALVDRALASGDLPAAEAIEQLEQLRFAWRGDSFEFALLQRLADLYEQEVRWREALRALRQAATYFPGTPRAEAAAEDLRLLFSRVFLGPDRPDLPPLTALSLYEEFRELTPAGDRGNRLIEELVDRLVAVDLLPRAGDLLEDQVEFRLAGDEQARVGARLALIRLFDRQPRKALEALEMSEQPDLSEELARQRRHLQARALSDLDRAPQGLALLQGDESLDAQRLRAEILWAQRDWAAASVALGASLPEPSGTPLDATLSGQVLNLAVALTLAGDQQRLTELRNAWGDAMVAGPHSEAFALLSEELDPGSVATIAQQLAQVDRVQAFMATYRERLQETQLSDLN